MASAADAVVIVGLVVESLPAVVDLIAVEEDPSSVYLALPHLG